MTIAKYLQWSEALSRAASARVKTQCSFLEQLAVASRAPYTHWVLVEAEGLYPSIGEDWHWLIPTLTLSSPRSGLCLFPVRLWCPLFVAPRNSCSWLTMWLEGRWSLTMLEVLRSKLMAKLESLSCSFHYRRWCHLNPSLHIGHLVVRGVVVGTVALWLVLP